MATLNLNFHKCTDRHEPTRTEIYEIEGVAVSIEAIIKVLAEYASGNRNQEEMGGVCVGVCRALELLITPVVDYLCDYAGNVPITETTPAASE